MRGEKADRVVPVLVYVSREEEGWLERFFVGEPDCGDGRFRVVQQSSADAVAVFLSPSERGYAYASRRVGPEELVMGGSPEGMIIRAGDGWAAASP